MRVRQRARQRGVELPLIISDHADWDELTQTITQVNPAETWITHGREQALLRWCELGQRRARALPEQYEREHDAERELEPRAQCVRWPDDKRDDSAPTKHVDRIGSGIDHPREHVSKREQQRAENRALTMKPPLSKRSARA